MVNMTPDDIRDIRARLDQTQQQLATRLGVSLATIRAWEQGLRQPGPDNIGVLKALSHSPEVRRVRLSQSLRETADLFEANGSPGMAAQLRRIADNQEASGDDPYQVEPV